MPQNVYVRSADFKNVEDYTEEQKLLPTNHLGISSLQSDFTTLCYHYDKVLVS